MQSEMQGACAKTNAPPRCMQASSDKLGKRRAGRPWPAEEVHALHVPQLVRANLRERGGKRRWIELQSQRTGDIRQLILVNLAAAILVEAVEETLRLAPSPLLGGELLALLLSSLSLRCALDDRRAVSVQNRAPRARRPCARAGTCAV